MGRRRNQSDSRLLAPLHGNRYHPTNQPHNMPHGSNAGSYGSLVRRTILFQFRLAADGIRDLLLSPISVIAALLGLLNPNNPSWALDRLMMIGRQSDRWINLFEQEDQLPACDRSQTMDDLFDHMEREVKTRMDPATPPDEANWADSFQSAFGKKSPNN